MTRLRPPLPSKAPATWPKGKVPSHAAASPRSAAKAAASPGKPNAPKPDQPSETGGQDDEAAHLDIRRPDRHGAPDDTAGPGRRCIRPEEPRLHLHRPRP